MNKQFLCELEVRRLPLPEVHVDSGPLTASSYPLWVSRSVREVSTWPLAEYVRYAGEAQRAFEAHKPSQGLSGAVEAEGDPRCVYLKDLLSFLEEGSPRAN